MLFKKFHCFQQGIIGGCGYQRNNLVPIGQEPSQCGIVIPYFVVVGPAGAFEQKITVSMEAASP
jgi:hypothetical protein